MKTLLTILITVLFTANVYSESFPKISNQSRIPSNISISPVGINLNNTKIGISNDFTKIYYGDIPILITKDDFSYSAPLKNFWRTSTSGKAAVTLGNSTVTLSTNGPNNTAKLYSIVQKSVNEGTLVFTAVLYTYEDNNTAYGPLARGLVYGMNRNYAIEFINTKGNTIQARTVSNGVATTTDYSVGESVAQFFCYTIIASDSKVEFYFDGKLIATHTKNIPAMPLNLYFDASTWSGNVPQTIDDVCYEIIPY